MTNSLRKLKVCTSDFFSSILHCTHPKAQSQSSSSHISVISPLSFTMQLAILRHSNKLFLHSEFSFSYNLIRHKSLTRITALNNKNMENVKNDCKVSSLDHLVLTVQDLDKSISFYTITLGMSLIKFGEGRHALQFGNQKINLHKAGQEFKPHAKRPTPGSADLCFVTEEPLTSWISKLQGIGVVIEEGPVKRTGAIGPMNSIYIRDPDANLVEIAFYGK